MGDEQEFEVVKAKVPRGFVRAGTELVVGVPQRGDLVRGNVHCPYLGERSVFLRPILLKPDWNPPKLKKGWLTWDDNGGWWWWPTKPAHTEEYGWFDAKTGCGGDGQEIAEVMEKFLGCPDCTGLDERNCIWEVSE